MRDVLMVLLALFVFIVLCGAVFYWTLQIVEPGIEHPKKLVIIFGIEAFLIALTCVFIWFRFGGDV